MSYGRFGHLNLSGESNSPMPSPAILRYLPRDAQLSSGLTFLDHFTSFDGSVASNVGRYNGDDRRWRSFEDTGCSLAQLATARQGVIRATTSTTDNHEVIMQAGGTASVNARLSSAAGQKEIVLREYSLAVGSVADSVAGVFVGLAEEGLAVTDGLLADGGTFQDKDFLGFWRAEGDGDQIDIVYRVAGGSTVTLLADALATANNSPITALTAATFVKLGFAYLPDHQEGGRILFFVNGQQLLTSLQLTNGAFAATFPNGEEMVDTFVIKNAAGASATADLDFAFGFQEILAT